MHKIASQNIVLHAEQEDAPQVDGVHLYDKKLNIYTDFRLIFEVQIPYFQK